MLGRTHDCAPPTTQSFCSGEATHGLIADAWLCMCVCVCMCACTQPVHALKHGHALAVVVYFHVFSVLFSGIHSFLNRALFLRLFQGLVDRFLEGAFCNQIGKLKVVQQFSFEFNSSLFPKSLSLLLLLLRFYTIHVSFFYN